MRFQRKDILALEEMTAGEMLLILDTADSMKEVITRTIKKVPTLRGRSLCTVFYENSTRTRLSFDLAAKYMSADTVGMTAAASSVQKGESLRDTAWSIEAMGVDAVVMRHPISGSCHYLAKLLKNAHVINAGDGMHEHPTQGLLDLFTIRERKGQIEGLEVAILGDIYHSRVARSNIWGLTKLGAKVRVGAPSTLLPPEIERLGVKAYTDIEKAVDGADVVNVLRLQLERQRKGLFPSTREYAAKFGLSADKLKAANPDVLVMHPGPMNRGVEIMSDVADAPYASVKEQVTNGVAVRMAILYLLLGGADA